MYCNNCKKEIPTDDKFCPDCGSPVSEMSCMQFVDNCIKTNTTYLTAQDFIQGAKPLKGRWIASAVTMGIIGIILEIVAQNNASLSRHSVQDVLYLVFVPWIAGLLCGLFVFVMSSIVYGFKVTKMELKTHKMPDNWKLQEETLQSLGTFLRENLSSLPLTKWECGNPAILGIRVSSILNLQCVFKNQTIHQICFPDKDKNSYCIKVFATTKHRWLRGGSHWGVVSFLRYKNAKIFHPILEAAIDYYIREKIAQPAQEDEKSEILNIQK